LAAGGAEGPFGDVSTEGKSAQQQWAEFTAKREVVRKAEDEIASEVDASTQATGKEITQRLAEVSAAELAAEDDFYYIPEEGKQ
jgi:hypothetical protein